MENGGYIACRKTVRFLDNLFDRMLLLMFLVVFLCGGYALYDSYAVYMAGTSDELQKYKPGAEVTDSVDGEIVGTMAAWLSMDGTEIDYPVMQGEDNAEYLSKDPFGNYSLAGSIFLDSRNDPGFTDGYSLVYGHHMEHGLMFGALDAYLDEEYFYGHRSGSLLFDDGTELPLTVFAVVETDGADSLIFSPTEYSNGEVLSRVREKACIMDQSTWPGAQERLVALSTCKFPDTADRTIVFCYIN